MKRLSGGFTSYFNEKHKRTGSLFGSKYKSIRVNSTEYLNHLSVYINLNATVHGLPPKSLTLSSWDEFLTNTSGICDKDIILGQYGSTYEKNAYEVLPEITRRKEQDREFARFTIEV